MFDKNEYWKKKQERKRVSEGRSFSWLIKASAFFEGFFAKPEAAADDVEPSPKKGHTRSPKERRMRRQRHAHRIRTIRAL